MTITVSQPPAGGPAGGDLTGTYPTPTVTDARLHPLDKDNGQAGMYCCPIPAVTVALSGNQARYVRFVPSRNMTIIKMAFAVTAFSAGDTADPAVDIGLYSAALARLGSSGATSGLLNATGAKVATLTGSVSLVAGTVYYAAVAPGALGTSTCSIAAQTAPLGSNSLFGATAGLVEAGASGTSHPLPNPLVLGAGTIMPFLAVRET